MNNKPVILLHGAIGAKDQLEDIYRELQLINPTYSFNFTGHGGDVSESPFSIGIFTKDLIRFLDEHNIQSAHIFGYSMGGYVALNAAKNFPDRVAKIMTLGTKFHWDSTTAEREIKNLDPEKILVKIPAFAAALEKRHGKSAWKKVLHKTAEMMLEMGEKNPLELRDYNSILQETLISIGDHDQMVSLEETVAVFRQLKNGSLLVIPDTAHPIEKVNAERIVQEVCSFFELEKIVIP